MINLAKIVDNSDENIKLCADIIKNGGIVGMPTETVYGLAANAFNIEAVKKIFEYKGRPLSDPLIVHVTSVKMAESLIDIDEETYNIFNLLAKKYWPGPLTIVLKANFKIISPILTANTECIGIRFPNNSIASKLIDYSGVPLAAPSANKFCHVSPVNPFHVFEDFKEFPVTIIDGGVCNFCMESTVIKLINNIDKNEKVIQILRMGALSKENFEEFISENKLCNYEVQMGKRKIIEVPNEIDIKTEITINANSNEYEIKLNQEAPGQFSRHYSPIIDTYILDTSEQINIIRKDDIHSIVVIDFKQIIKKEYGNIFNHYLDLSSEGNPEEVMHNLYDYLRNAEKIENASIIIICDIQKYMNYNSHKDTLIDRVVKASSNRRINILNFNK